MIRNVLLAGVVLLGSISIAHAVDINERLSLDTELKMSHKMDAESTLFTINPELSWDASTSLEMTMGTKITGWDSTLTGDRFIMFDALENGSHPDIDLGATYTLTGGMEIFGNTKWDLNEGERKEIEVGLAYTF